MWSTAAADDSLIPGPGPPPAEAHRLCELTDGDQRRDEWEPSKYAQVSGRCEKICPGHSDLTGVSHVFFFFV